MVALDGAVGLIADVTCAASPPSVRVRLAAGAPPGGASVGDLYPVGAVLAVNSDLYGACLLGPPQGGLAAQDGYLVITGASGTPEDAVVVGTRGTWLSTVDAATLRVVDEAAAAAGVVRSASRGSRSGGEAAPAATSAVAGGGRDVDRLDAPAGRQFSVQLESTSTFLALTLKFVLQVDITVAVDMLTLTWEGSDLSIDALLRVEQGIKAELTADLSESIGADDIVFDPFPSFPLLGVALPTRFLLPPARLGAFGQVLVLPVAKAQLSRPLMGLTSGLDYQSGVTLYRLRVGAGGLFDVEQRAPARFSATLPEPLDALFGTEAPADVVTLTLGLFIRPQIVLSAPGLELKAFVEFGVDGEATGVPVAEQPLLPLPLPELPDSLGICDECHRAEFRAAAKLRPAVVFATDVLFAGESKVSVRIPGVTVPLLTECRIRPTDPAQPQVACFLSAAADPPAAAQCCAPGEVCTLQQTEFFTCLKISV